MPFMFSTYKSEMYNRGNQEDYNTYSSSNTHFIHNKITEMEKEQNISKERLNSLTIF